MSLKEILEKIQNDLVRREQIRDEVNRDMRKATRLSKQAIQVIHQERFNEAQALLEEAKTLFVKLKKTAKSYPYIFYSGSVGAAFEENAEAHIFLSLIKEERFPSPKEIDVPETPYLLSLGDIVGELRRRVLDLIRNDKIRQAEACLEIMDQIYSEMMSIDEAYTIVNGLRRNGDIARRLIEITRGDITIEVRRNMLEKSISKLNNKLENSNQK